jgi:hypothetical protein
MSPGPCPHLAPGGVLVPAAATGPLLDELLRIVAQATRSANYTLPDLPLTTALARALNAAGPISATGNPAPSPARVVDMRSADDAAREVGLTGRRVRQLCRAGLVRHQFVGTRTYLVDVASLHTHLRTPATHTAHQETP